MGAFASVTVSKVESMLGSNSYPFIYPIMSANPKTFSTKRNPIKYSYPPHTIHEIGQVNRIAPPLRIPVRQHPRIVELPAKQIGYDDHYSPGGGGGANGGRMRHVGVEAVDRLFAAGRGALVQDAGGAVFAGERGCHFCFCFCCWRLVG